MKRNLRDVLLFSVKVINAKLQMQKRKFVLNSRIYYKD